MIVSVKDNENSRWKRNAHTKKNKVAGSYSERVRDKWFCWVFTLGFLKLICKASLIFKSNLKLALSIILKKRELYESQHVAVECKCLKIWDLLSFLICYSILVLKWRQVSSIELELQLAQVNLYTRKDFKSSGIGSLYEKWFLILNEVKTNLMLTFPLQNSLQRFESLFLVWCDRLPIYGNLK